MFFILQKEGKYIDNQEVFVMNDILRRHTYIHEHSMMGMNEMSSQSFLSGIKEIEKAIPIGSIEFVQAYLTNVHGIETMSPIEIPECLREEEFVKRDYRIVEKKELPKAGYHFTKYVSNLKYIHHRGMIEELHNAQKGGEPLLKKGLYQVSEVVDFIVEYRCFVMEGKIMGIQYYEGDCTVFPSEQDMNTLKKMIERYQADPTHPLAYTLDIGIIKDRGLALIECHTHVSVGLYGLQGNFLLHSYRYGLDWYIKHNIALQPFHLSYLGSS